MASSQNAPRGRVAAFLHSSIGKKTVTAVSGLLLIGFLVTHLAGNLTLLVDDDGAAFNTYAQGLKDLGVGLYVLEVGLLALFALHIYMALRVNVENREARNVRYAVRADRGEKTLGSASMVITGVLVLAFLVVHLFDFRFQPTAFAEDPAALVTATLTNPLKAAVYMAGFVVLVIHLSHAFQSAFQSIGIHHPQLRKPLRQTGYGIAWLLGAGFAAIVIVLFMSYGKGS